MNMYIYAQLSEMKESNFIFNQLRAKVLKEYINIKNSLYVFVAAAHHFIWKTMARVIDNDILIIQDNLKIGPHLVDFKVKGR